MDTVKPPYVVLNMHTAHGMVTMGAKREDVGACLSLGTPDSPCFAGTGTEMEFYILRNYELAERFDYAAILKRREHPVDFSRKFKTNFSYDGNQTERPAMEITGLAETERPGVFKITQRTATIVFPFTDPRDALYINTDFIISAGPLLKLLSKARVSVKAEFEPAGENASGVYFDLLKLGTVQSVGVGFQNQVVRVKKLTILIETPAPYLLPDRFELKGVQFTELIP